MGTSQEPAPVDNGSSSSGKAQSDATTTPDNLGGTGTAIVTSIWLSATVSDPLEAADQATVITKNYGGYVESRSENTGTPVYPLGSNTDVVSADVTTVTLTVRVPTDDLETALEDLRNIGNETSFNQSQYNVSAEKANLDAQIATLTGSLESLRKLQSQATNVSDLLLAEEAIAQRQATLDGLIAQHDYLISQLDMTSVSMTYTAQSSAEINQQSFWDGVVNGWAALQASGGVLIVVSGFILPWLGVVIVLAAVALGIVWLVKRQKRRKPKS